MEAENCGDEFMFSCALYSGHWIKLKKKKPHTHWIKFVPMSKKKSKLKTWLEYNV